METRVQQEVCRKTIESVVKTE